MDNPITLAELHNKPQDYLNTVIKLSGFMTIHSNSIVFVTGQGNRHPDKFSILVDISENDIWRILGHFYTRTYMTEENFDEIERDPTSVAGNPYALEKKIYQIPIVVEGYFEESSHENFQFQISRISYLSTFAEYTPGSTKVMPTPTYKLEAYIEYGTFVQPRKSELARIKATQKRTFKLTEDNQPEKQAIPLDMLEGDINNQYVQVNGKCVFVAGYDKDGSLSRNGCCAMWVDNLPGIQQSILLSMPERYLVGLKATLLPGTKDYEVKAMGYLDYLPSDIAERVGVGPKPCFQISNIQSLAVEDIRFIE